MSYIPTDCFSVTLLNLPQVFQESPEIYFLCFLKSELTYINNVIWYNTKDTRVALILLQLTEEYILLKDIFSLRFFTCRKYKFTSYSSANVL